MTTRWPIFATPTLDFEQEEFSPRRQHERIRCSILRASLSIQYSVVWIKGNERETNLSVNNSFGNSLDSRNNPLSRLDLLADDSSRLKEMMRIADVERCPDLCCRITSRKEQS